MTFWGGGEKAPGKDRNKQKVKKKEVRKAKRKRNAIRRGTVKSYIREPYSEATTMGEKGEGWGGLTRP